MGWDESGRVGNAEGCCWVRLGRGALRRTRSPGAGKAAEEPITGGHEGEKVVVGGESLFCSCFQALEGGEEQLEDGSVLFLSITGSPLHHRIAKQGLYCRIMGGGGGEVGFYCLNFCGLLVR